MDAFSLKNDKLMKYYKIKKMNYLILLDISYLIAPTFEKNKEQICLGWFSIQWAFEFSKEHVCEYFYAPGYNVCYNKHASYNSRLSHAFKIEFR